MTSVAGITISKQSFVSDLVRQDYRTARIFRKYNIDFCCGGKYPLESVCEMAGLDFDIIKAELEHSIRTTQLSGSIQFNTWNVDFLTDYIIHVHHHYLREALPLIKDQLDNFASHHTVKYPYLKEVQQEFNALFTQAIPHLKEEEEIIFPYIRQIAHAYESKEPYASLLVRTLRKPVENVMHHEHESVSKVLFKLRELTNEYTLPGNACISHRVTLSFLKELDSDLVQHLYLENQILFPKAIAMEKDLLLKR